MKITIPKSWEGREGKADYERIMRGEDKPVETPKVNPNPLNKKDLADFIYVPSINLYVAKERTHLDNDWFECHKLLQNNKERMLIIPEFIEFLKYIKSSNNQEYQNIYKDITEVRSPWRAEWLDADFKIINKILHVNYNHILDSSGNLNQKNSEILDENTLMEDKIPGISLEDYLNNSHTKQGLPNKNISNGNLYYLNPRKDNNSVARFDASSVWAALYCVGVPSNAHSVLGYGR